MPTVSIELHNVAGTDTALGWAGAHTTDPRLCGGRSMRRRLCDSVDWLQLAYPADLKIRAHAVTLRNGCTRCSVHPIWLAG